MTDHRTVVISMDGSDCADFAFEWYLEQIRRPNDYVIFVHCPEYNGMFEAVSFGMGEATVEGDMTKMFGKEAKLMKELVNNLGEKLRDVMLSGKVKCVPGSHGDVILKVAEEEQASFIIAGRRGIGTLRRTFLGSVSDYVVHHRTIPVLVCCYKHGD
ncbi:uncharacterized protein [Haliotis asinina]|uniref:uncharacterized protein n=1 Tax=Haliotis asinina TaxID=109174 RepID=UPI0035321A8C